MVEILIIIHLRSGELELFPPMVILMMQIIYLVYIYMQVSYYYADLPDLLCV